jgi:DNA (cytosine-5)-methyltransferase 1
MSNIELNFINNKECRIADFCVGTGGFTLASQLADNELYKTIFANDMDKNSKIIYTKNFGDSHFQLCDIHDIKEETIPYFDVLTAGFPCQSYSLAGNKLGFDDPRADVFWKLMKIIRYHKPRFVIFENVKNLHTHDNGNTFKTISSSIKDAGYFFKYKILNTCKITGIPQNRERIYIVCCKNRDDYELLDLEFPEKNNVSIKNILEQKVDNKYYYKPQSIIYNKLKESVVKDDTFYQYRRTFVRENKSGVCPTLTANAGTGGHNVCIIKDLQGIRKITPRESFKLQGFPDSYILNNLQEKSKNDILSDSVLYKLAGNAITVEVAKLIFEKISQIIKHF